MDAKVIRFFTVVVVFVVLSQSYASTINWSWQDFSVNGESYYWDGEHGDNDFDSNGASALAVGEGRDAYTSLMNPYTPQETETFSEVYRGGADFYTMDAEAWCTTGPGSANCHTTSRFEGSYTATADTLQIDIWYDYSLRAEGIDAISEAENSAYLSVSVVEGYENGLYSGYIFDANVLASGITIDTDSDSNTIRLSIPVPVGNSIWVGLELYETADAWGYASAGDNSAYVDITITEVPEPVSVLLLGAGILALRRKRKN